MKNIIQASLPVLALLFMLGLGAADQASLGKSAKILFLHHSTGENIWNGGLEAWLAQYNTKNGTSYAIRETAFPNEPYEWANYPFDYWLLWVKQAGKGYQGQPTLEKLARENTVLIWKHCFPGSALEEDSGQPAVDSDVKSLENYKLQYNALKKKMKESPNVRFILWTLALEVEGNIDPGQAGRAREFVRWVKTDWDEKGDNIFLWDFHALESENGLFLKKKYSSGGGDAHPNEAFSRKAAPLLGRRIVDVIEGRGDSGSLTGQ